MLQRRLAYSHIVAAAIGLVLWALMIYGAIALWRAV